MTFFEVILKSIFKLRKILVVKSLHGTIMEYTSSVHRRIYICSIEQQQKKNLLSCHRLVVIKLNGPGSKKRIKKKTYYLLCHFVNN